MAIDLVVELTYNIPVVLLVAYLFHVPNSAMEYRLGDRVMARQRPPARTNWRLVIKPERLRDVRFANIIVVAERGCV